MSPKGYEERVSNRLIIVFAWSALLLWAITWLGSILAKGGLTYYIATAACMFLAYASVISMIFGIGWYIIASVRGRAPEGHTFNGALLALLSFMLLGGSGLLAVAGDRGIGAAYIILPLLGLLYLLWAVYSRTVFALNITLIPVIFCLYFLYKLSPAQDQSYRTVWGFVALGVVLITALLYAVFQRWRGIALLGEAMDKGRVAAIYGGTAAGVIAAWIFGSVAALIPAIVLGLFLIIVLVVATAGLIGWGENVPME